MFVLVTRMFSFSSILSDLQAAIAARAARDRTLTVLLLAVWGRIARMRGRLERLVALWRAGILPAPRPPRARKPAKSTSRPAYPTGPDWLLRTLGYEAVAVGLQLRHLLTEAECGAFLAAVPQAGRVLRPLLRMLGADPLPEVLYKPAVVPAVAASACGVESAVVASAPDFRFLGA